MEPDYKAGDIIKLKDAHRLYVLLVEGVMGELRVSWLSFQGHTCPKLVNMPRDRWGPVVGNISEALAKIESYVQDNNET